MFTKKLIKILRQFNEWKRHLWMNACMHDYAKEHGKHGEVKSTKLELKGNNAIW